MVRQYRLTSARQFGPSRYRPAGTAGSSDPDRYVQTTPVLPGSACVATMCFPVPGNFKLVDHALSRVARKGALAVVTAEGEEDPEIFDPEPQS